MSKTAIKFENVSKIYQLGRTNFRSYKNYLPKILSSIPALSGKGTDPDKVFYALNDVSFELKQGEALGVVGPTGREKAPHPKAIGKHDNTHLRHNNKGGQALRVDRIGGGISSELTGRENVYLYGSIMGLKRRRFTRSLMKLLRLPSLSNLSTPIKHYSSGMYARLGFAVAIHVDPEILLIDEVLAVGDMNFRKKCL